MQNFIYLIVLPGLNYEADGPLWIDKLKITAFINGASVQLYNVKNNTIDIDNPQQSIVLHNNQKDYKDIVLEDGITHTILPVDSDLQTEYLNNSDAVKGLCAVLFAGTSTDIVKFSIDIYTSKTWVNLENQTYRCKSDADSQYMYISTEQVEYNPFIQTSTPAQVILTNYIKQDIDITPYKDIITDCIITDQFSLSDKNDKHIYLDGQIKACVNYDDLPKTRFVYTSATYKNCIKDWTDEKHMSNIEQIIGSNKCHFLMFDNDLPYRFGEDESSDDGDKLAICAYRKSINGSVGRQRYTLVGVERESLDVSDYLYWKGNYSYDCTHFMDSVKYYSQATFNISINTTLADNPNFISYTQPCELYKYSSSDDCYTLQSGSGWKTLINTSGRIDTASTWTINDAYKDIRNKIWTHRDNKGTPIPTDKDIKTLKYTPEIGQTNKQCVITSSDSQLKKTVEVKIVIPQLTDIQYITFVDSSYDKRKFSKLILASTQLKHPVEGAYIQVIHTPTKFSLSDCSNVNVAVDAGAVPTIAGYAISQTIEFKTEGDGKTYAWPIEDSLNGTIEVSTVKTGSDINITCGENVTSYPHNAAKGSMQNAHDEPAYWIKGNGNIDVQISSYNVLDGKSYILKWTEIPADEAGNPDWDNIKLVNLNTRYAFLNSQTNSFSIKGKDVLVGSIGIIETDADNITTTDNRSSIKQGTVALSHSLGCYEDITLFNIQDLQYNKVYFPPANTLCVGFYRINSSDMISIQDIKFLYNDIPVKNQTIKSNFENSVQYRKLI